MFALTIWNPSKESFFCEARKYFCQNPHGWPWTTFRFKSKQDSKQHVIEAEVCMSGFLLHLS